MCLGFICMPGEMATMVTVGDSGLCCRAHVTSFEC